MRKYIPLALLFAALPLSGCFVAGVAAGTTAATTVAEERSVGNAVDDTGIKLTIKNAMLHQQGENLFLKVEVEVVEGRVLLTGTVAKPENAIRAVDLAWRAEGVKEVINEIQVTDKSGVWDYTKDAWISGQIKTKLLFTKNIRSINYNIETVNGVVYLLGLAQNQQELDGVLHIARTTQYVQQVVSHVRFRDDPRRKGM